MEFRPYSLRDRSRSTPSRLFVASESPSSGPGRTAQAFHAATDYGARYELRFCASSTETASAQGLIFKTETELPEVGRDDLIVIPGQWSKYTKNGPLLTARVKAWLRDAYKSGAHLASVCSGAFALGEAGFLNGRRCTTHWSLTDELQRRYPDARVATKALYVHDGRITSLFSLV